MTGGEVVLVDEAGAEIGAMGKLEAHRPPGHLHLAFSVLVCTPEGKVVLQRRAAGKYHFAGRWSNACCSHPAPGEQVEVAAARRLAEEMGLSCALSVAGTFRYDAADPVTGLIERELDVVLVGTSGQPLAPDPREVAEVRLATLAEVEAGLATTPDDYTPWLAKVLSVAGLGRMPGG